MSHTFPIQASDILVSGFIAHTFSPEGAHNYLALLLETQDYLRHYRISYSQGAWYMMQNPPYFPPPPPGIPPQNLMLPLDFNFNGTQGSVIPQRRWTRDDENHEMIETGVSRYVPNVPLLLPIYFVNRDGEIGFWLPDILQGRDHDLNNGDGEAPLGGKPVATQVRINVSYNKTLLCWLQIFSTIFFDAQSLTVAWLWPLGTTDTYSR